MSRPKPEWDLVAPKSEPQRDRWQRPLIVPDGGGKATAYMRATTLAGTLEDTFNLSRWQQRMVAVGLASREDLLLSVAAHREDKNRLNDVCEKAIEAAKGGAGAVTGTALHAFTDQLDRGRLDLANVPSSHRADLEAFASVTSALEVAGIECFGVLDDLQVAGTCDRIYAWPPGSRNYYIGDTKSGSLDWGAGKIAIQLALYSRMRLYDPATGRRGLDMSNYVDQHKAIVVHLPAGTGKAELVWVDIESGWRSVQLARKVREWRKTTGWLRPCSLAGEQNVDQVDLLSLAIAEAASLEVLTDLYRAHRADGWSDLHTDLAKARRAALEPAQT